MSKKKAKKIKKKVRANPAPKAKAKPEPAAKPTKVTRKPRGKTAPEPEKLNRKEFTGRVEELRENVATLRMCLGNGADPWANAAAVRADRALYALDRFPGLADRTDKAASAVLKLSKRETTGAFKSLLHIGEALILAADHGTDQANNFEFYQKAKDVLRGATSVMNDPLTPLSAAAPEAAAETKPDEDEEGDGGDDDGEGDPGPEDQPSSGGATVDPEMAPVEPIAETTPEAAPEPAEATASAREGRWGAEPDYPPNAQ